MAAERYLQILEQLQALQSGDPGKSKLCAVAANVTGLDGAAVALISSGNDVLEFCATSALSSRLLDIEAAVGQGPCLIAWRNGEAVMEPELGHEISPLWTLYAPLANAEGVRAVFAFAVEIGAVRLGALLLYRFEPGPLSSLQLSDGFLLASMIARAVLALQSGASDSLLSGALEHSATFDFVIQQAAGMVAVQGTMSVHEALVLIRAHGFGVGSSSSQLARYIVAGEIAYDGTTGEWVSHEGTSWSS